METATGVSLGRLELADWRRRVAELYGEVRRLAALDPITAHVFWREFREALYRQHPASPVPAEQRSGFRSRHFEYDPALRFELEVRPVDGSERAPRAKSADLGLRLPASSGEPLGFERVGRLEVPFASGPRRLSLFWLPEYSGGLFLSFRDGTNGGSTYGGGRYVLDSAKGADLGPGRVPSSIVVDFNFAYQPSCAFDPRWSCPLPPPENWLDLEVKAGERIA